MEKIEDKGWKKSVNVEENALFHPNNSASQPEIQAETASSDNKPSEDVLKPLTDKERAKIHKPQAKEEKTHTVLFPLPKDAPAFTKNTPDHHNKEFYGKPVGIYPYTVADGSLAFYMVRWHPLNEDGTPKLNKDGKPDKEPRPYCYVEDKGGKKHWRSCGFPEPRPLYNLPDLIARPQAPVLVVEGEKNVEILKPILPDYVVITSSNGAQSPHKSDWSVLKGRNIIICPDYDKGGIQYSDAVCLKSREAEALSIQALSIELLAKSLLKKERIPEKYDLADAVNDGLNPVILNQSLESFLSPYLTRNERISQKFPDGFRLNGQGSIEYFFEKKNKNGDVTESGWKWLCGYLVVTHRTRDKDNGEWAKIASLTDGDGIRKEVKITASLLSGDGNPLKELLLKSGLSLNIDAGNKLKSYLSQSNPSARIRTIDKVGWYKNTYVLPNKVYGTAEWEDIVLHMEGILPTYQHKGTLAEWQENIGQYLEDNSVLQGSVLIGLVSSVLTPLGHENFGIHCYGHSSLGKSTASHIACSVYGSELRTWRTTDNSAEAWGLQSNDNLLALDEISQVSAEALAESIYMIFNGQGKGRMTRKGGARPTSKFNTCVWSNGEKGTEAKIKESKRNLTYNAGQAVRMMDIPADAGSGFGVFNTLHRFEDGLTFSNHLKEKSGLYRGSVGDAWLTLLTEHLEEVLTLVKQEERKFIEETPLKLKDGQVERAISHFSLLAAVGEVAIEKGILPWKKGSAIKACQSLLNAWIGQRGGLESHEAIKFKEEVITFLLEQGTMRFELISQKTTEDFQESSSNINKPRTKDRMGFVKEVNGITEYYAFTETFDKELIKGRDKKTLMNFLTDYGILERDKDRFSQVKRLPEFGTKRVYVLKLPQEF